MGERLPRLELLGDPVVEDVRGWIDPLAALAAIGRRRHVVLLLSALEGHPESRYSILACDPVMTVRLEEGRAGIAGGSAADGDRAVLPVEDPFALLRGLAPSSALRNAAGLPFVGGAIGVLGYGLRRSIESFSRRPVDPLRQPDAWFGLYEAAVLFDHAERRVLIAGTPSTGGAGAPRERLRDEFATLRAGLAASVRMDAPGRPPLRPPVPRRARAMTAPGVYLARVRSALDAIAAGEIYQVNLSQRIVIPHEDDPLVLFRRLSERHPAPFAAYLDLGEMQVVSSSPERFLSLRGRRARSAPIKGTRPRGATAESDRDLAEALVASAKDRAENVMIADLVRNDLGRVCETGSVRVEALCRLESFTTVHHLVSEVRGRLRADRDRFDLVGALFPGGSMTGAPKPRAMEFIDELETEERGIYSGSLGYFSFDGGLDLSIVIRTLLCRGGEAHLRVGGGIVAGSEPLAEYRESLDKARGLLEVLGAEL